MDLPNEILHDIAHWVCGPSIFNYYLSDRAYKMPRPDCQTTLANMRLSSKALCRVASPKFFQHVIYRNWRTWPLEKLRQLCDSAYASSVRQVDIGCRQSDDVQTYLEDLIGLLPFLVCKLPNLSSLDFDYDAGLQFPVESRMLISSSIATTLRYVELPKLEELDISVPITFDFGQLLSRGRSPSRIPIEAVCGRLRHLGLRVRNYTSQNGQRYWPERVLLEDKAFPNESFATNLFELVEAAENLESLSIHCTNPLDFDEVRFPLRLRSVFLYRVVISSNTLSAILGNFLISVQLYVVQLKAGTWQSTLTNLAHSSPKTLVEFYMDSCGYSSTGASSHLREQPPHDMTSPIPLETRNRSDSPALLLLQKTIIKNRAAQRLPDEPAYNNAKLFSMEDLMSMI